MPVDVLGLDIEKLLAPVAENNAVGVDVRKLVDQKSKSLLMGEIEQKRRAILSGLNENLEPKREWNQVEEMLTDAFRKGKELGAAVCLVQAVVINRGWGALGPCFRFLRLLQERFWEALYPASEEDESGVVDFTCRLLLLERLDHENYMPLAIALLPITNPKGATVFSIGDYQQLLLLKRAPIGLRQDAAERRQLIEDREQAFDEAISRSGQSWYQALLTEANNGLAELENLRGFVERRYTGSSHDDRPTFRRTAEALDYCAALASQLLTKVGGAQVSTSIQGEITETSNMQSNKCERILAAPDHDVVQLLERALSSLRSQQRHNPAEVLVSEAIRWTNMSISSWYLEVSEDTALAAFVAGLMRRVGARAGS